MTNLNTYTVCAEKKIGHAEQIEFRKFPNSMCLEYIIRSGTSIKRITHARTQMAQF